MAADRGPKTEPEALLRKEGRKEKENFKEEVEEGGRQGPRAVWCPGRQCLNRRGQKG